MEPAPRVPVVIIGGGPAGLVASMLLSRHGARHLLVEKRSSTSVLPRATGINLRSMEIFRSLGLESEITAASMNMRDKPLWVELETLAGSVLREQPFTVPSGTPQKGFPSPVAHTQCAQDVLEPLLLAHVENSPHATVQFGTEALALHQRDDHVVVELVDPAGVRREIAADYLVAADGGGSRIREQLAIPMQGTGPLGTQLNILFEADLSPLVRDHSATLYRVANPKIRGIFRPVDDTLRWTLTAEAGEDVSDAACRNLVTAGVGDQSIEPQILAAQQWELRADVATQLRNGRVFLIGDAAHRMTPGGAMGMNTAIHDAHNLAWKLAGVLQGWAGSRLLDSYQDERQPVARRNAELSLTIWNDMTKAGRTAGAVLGVTYQSHAILPDGTTPPALANSVTDYAPSATPGARAPHLWLDDGRSTLDLLGNAFTLLTGDESVSVVEPRRQAVLLPTPWRGGEVGVRLHGT